MMSLSSPPLGCLCAWLCVCMCVRVCACLRVCMCVGVVYMGGMVYAVVGSNGSLRVRTVDSYDPVKDEWCCVSSMQDRRSTLGAAVLNGLLYAVGGFDGAHAQATAENLSYEGHSLTHSLALTHTYTHTHSHT